MLLLAVVAVLVVAAVIYLAAQNDVIESKYALEGNVSDLNLNGSKIVVGVSNDPTELNFGAIAVNMTVEKFVEINNSADRPAFVKISMIGNIVPYIRRQDNNFILESGSNRSIGMIFNGTQKGYFTGQATIQVITPKYPVLSSLSLWS